MSADPFYLNRPVHLARRDVFYDKAADSIRQLSSSKEPAVQRRIAEQALYLLRESRRCKRRLKSAAGGGAVEKCNTQ